MVALGAIRVSAAESNEAINEARINQVQVIGTHNSYHIAQPKPLLAEIAKNSTDRSLSSFPNLESVKLNSIYSPTPRADTTQSHRR